MISLISLDILISNKFMIINFYFELKISLPAKNMILNYDLTDARNTGGSKVGSQ